MEHYHEAERMARRLEGVEVVRYKKGEDPWLILRVDGRIVAVPKAANDSKKLIDFVCRFRNLQARALDDTDVQTLLDE